MKKRELELKEIQQIELEILEYLHQLCQEHHITYFIDFGTLLGAVRHKGFIPWDDDTDISLARDEFEKLVHILRHTEHERFGFIDFHTNPDYPFPYARVYDKRTFRETSVKNKALQLGTCVDIFAYDGYITNALDKKKINAFNKFRILSYNTLDGIVNHKKSFMENLGRKIAYGIFRHTHALFWNQKIEKIARSYSVHQARHLELSTYHSQPSPNIPKEWLYDVIQWPFEGRQFNVPRAYHQLLVVEFGPDYMTPLPSSEIINGQDKNYIMEE